MLRRINHLVATAILVVGFLLFALTNNLLLGGLRLDLTDNKLYTLSSGTREILAGIDEPVNLYFFFSGKVSEDLTSLRAYAQRVREVLEEYELRADGKLKLHLIDPEPFSEEEDQAAAFGLQKVQINQAGDEFYFGLAGTNALDDREIISFFQPDKEEFLEYELSKLIYSLSADNRSVLGLFSGLPVDGQIDQTTYQVQPAWVVIKQLKELFNVKTLSELSGSSLADLDLLMLVHPKNLTDAHNFAIDQFVMAGGKLLAFVDPLAELEQPDPAQPSLPDRASAINTLSGHWGVRLRESGAGQYQVLADANAALLVNDAAGTPVRHLAIPGFSAANFSSDSIVTAPLESVNMATAGILEVTEVAGIEVETLIKSSNQAMPLDSVQFQFLTNPADLQQGFKATGEIYPVAVRLSGSATTAFPAGGPSGEADFIESTDQLQVVIVADTDVLSDRLWVQVQSFFGQQVATAFADNGSLITNLVDNLSGSNALISVRSRGRFSRPFTLVEDLRRKAEASYLQKQEGLQARLTETEKQLNELQSNRVVDGVLTLTPEQQAALNQFQAEKLKIRKALREVRHQLDRDIEFLGSSLKFLNIILLPVLLTALLLAVRLFRRRRGVARSSVVAS